MKRTKRWGLIVVVIGLAVGCGAWWNISASTAPSQSFRSVATERGDLAVTISATGTVQPEQVVDVGAQVAGMIQQFGPDPRDSKKFVDYGTPVEKGTVLAQIDDSLYLAQVNRARAQVDQAQAGVEQAEAQVTQAIANARRAEADLDQMRAKLYQTGRDFNRAKDLKQKASISALDYDSAEATFQTAKSALAVGDASLDQANAGIQDARANVLKLKASLADAKVALQTAEINLGYCTVKSPVKGVIIDRRVNVGQTVVASLSTPSLFLIAKDLKRVQVWSSVNEADIGQVRPGLKVRFSVDAFPGKEFIGEVAQVRLNAMMTQNVVTYTVVVAADNSAELLLPYLTANVKIEIAWRKNVLTVPNSALRWHPGVEQIAPDYRESFPPTRSGDLQSTVTANKGTIWIMEGAYVRPITVLTGLSDGTRTEILDGYLADEAHVVTGTIQPTRGEAAANPFTPRIPGKK